MNPRQRRGVRIPIETRLQRLTVEIPDPSIRNWGDTIRAGAPETPRSTDKVPRKVWGAEQLFEEAPISQGRAEVQLIHFGSTQHEYHDLVAYAEANELVSGHPRHCLAVGEQYPNLRSRLGCQEKDSCAINLPRAFPVADINPPNMIFHVIFDQNGGRMAEVSEMWRRTYFWEWFLFLPVHPRLHQAG